MYSTNVFTERATTLITNHPPEKVNLASLLISKSREDSISAQVNIGRGPCLLGNNLISSRLVKNMTAMQETWVQSPGRKDPLEEEMATHSSFIACRIPWTEKQSRLQSMGWQRVGPDCVTDFHFYFFTFKCQSTLVSAWEACQKYKFLELTSKSLIHQVWGKICQYFKEAL